MKKQEIQDMTKIRVFGMLDQTTHIEGDFSLLVWNIHKCLSKNLPRDIHTLLREVDIVIFQEALLSEKWENMLATFEGFCWGFFKGFHFPGRNILSGVMTGSRYTMSDYAIHSTVDREPLLRTHKSSGLSYFPIVGKTEKLLVINTHAMNFNLGKPFKRQIQETLEMIQEHIGPMIWAGDFNTWSRGRKDFLTDIAASLGLSWLEPLKDNRLLKLDHILYRGVDPLYAEVMESIKSSDHKPIIAGFRVS